MKLSTLKHLVVTHADFDGIASAINVYNIVADPQSNFQYYVANYHNISKILYNLKRDKFDVLWILDLNLTREQIDLLKLYDCQKIIWIDHHQYEYDVKEYIKTIPKFRCLFIHDKTKSACRLTNEFISANWEKAALRCKELCDLGDIYDMWRTVNPRFIEAYSINDLYWEYKYEKFFNVFKDGYHLIPEDKATILAIHNERREYEADTIANYIQHNKEYDIAYVLNPKCNHINHITLVYPAKYYVILKKVDEKSIAYSIRIYDSELGLTIQEVFAIIKKSGIVMENYGGHEQIGGIQIPIEENRKFLESINSIFEGKLQ